MKFPGNLTKCFDKDLYLMFLDGFEFVPDFDSEDFTAWFRTPATDHRNYLCRFAQEGTGGLFCFWNKDGGDDYSNSPVIYLGSEGERGVAARNFDDFLRVLSSGFILFSLVFAGKQYHFSEAEEDPEEKKENQATFDEFVSWLRAECSIEPAKDVLRMQSDLADLNAEFQSWIEARGKT